MNFKIILMRLLVCVLLWGVGSSLFPAKVSADGSSGDSKVVLTVEHKNKKSQLTVLTELTLSDLQLLLVTEFTTSTIWTAEKQTFTGVELAELIAHLEIKAELLHAVALDEYYLDLAISDAVTGGPIIAYFNNGKQMTTRDKGPLWIVYPYDNS